jgi:hypothetical protein
MKIIMSNLHERLIILNNKYFLAGNYVIDFPKNSNYQLNFYEKYNHHLNATILESVVNISLLNIPIKVIIQKPLNQVHRYEFEEHFGFGDHCEGFDSNKKIILCPKSPIMPFEELFAKLNLDNMTEDTIKDLCLLMILGGYWNKRQAVEDLLNFLQSDIKTVDVFDSLFQKYLVTD